GPSSYPTAAGRPPTDTIQIGAVGHVSITHQDEIARTPGAAGTEDLQANRCPEAPAIAAGPASGTFGRPPPDHDAGVGRRGRHPPTTKGRRTRRRPFPATHGGRSRAPVTRPAGLLRPRLPDRVRNLIGELGEVVLEHVGELGRGRKIGRAHVCTPV